MVRYFVLFLLLILFIPPASAQNLLEEAEEEILLPGEEGFVPLGKKGRITPEQGAAIAVNRIFGEVVSQVAWNNDRIPYLEYQIKTPHESIYEIEINANTAEIEQIWVVQHTEGAHIPFTLKEQDVAEADAVKYVQNEARGGTKAKALSSSLQIIERRFCWLVRVKKLTREYEVAVDATEGGILSMEEVD